MKAQRLPAVSRFEGIGSAHDEPGASEAGRSGVHAYWEVMNYELEFGVFIGKSGMNIPARPVT